MMDKNKIDMTDNRCELCRHKKVCKYRQERLEIISFLENMDMKIEDPFLLSLYCKQKDPKVPI